MIKITNVNRHPTTDIKHGWSVIMDVLSDHIHGYDRAQPWATDLCHLKAISHTLNFVVAVEREPYSIVVVILTFNDPYEEMIFRLKYL